MKNQEIKDLSTQDLMDKLAAEKVELNKLTLNHAISPVENPMAIKATRRNIARMMTELHKRELTVK
jgi:large subunit ribosomal protein L29